MNSDNSFYEMYCSVFIIVEFIKCLRFLFSFKFFFLFSPIQNILDLVIVYSAGLRKSRFFSLNFISSHYLNAVQFKNVNHIQLITAASQYK